jgi:protease-4
MNPLIAHSQNLYNKLFRWRLYFFLILLVLIIVLTKPLFNERSVNHIARIKISTEISYNPAHIDILKEIANNDHVKAIILHIDSPGGTTVGSEIIHKNLLKIKTKKPIMVLVNNYATSGAYMIAMTGNKIYAYENSVVGSIGIILQSFEVNDLAKKLGVELITYKSSPLKAIPNTFEKISEDMDKELKTLINDHYQIFLKMVKENRPQIKNEYCDGRVFIGQNALNIGFIDVIGDEDNIMSDLEQNYQLSSKIKIIEWHEFENAFYDDNSSFSFKNLINLFKMITDILYKNN